MHCGPSAKVSSPSGNTGTLMKKLSHTHKVPFENKGGPRGPQREKQTGPHCSTCTKGPSSMGQSRPGGDTPGRGVQARPRPAGPQGRGGGLLTAAHTTPGVRLPRRQPASSVWRTVAPWPAPQPLGLAPTGPTAPEPPALTGSGPGHTRRTGPS